VLRTSILYAIVHFHQSLHRSTRKPSLRSTQGLVWWRS